MRKSTLQVSVRSISIAEIVGHANFARGLDDARSGQPFDWILDNDGWFYGRGRQFAYVVPLDLSLRIGRQINPTAIALFIAASKRGWIL